MKLGFACAWKKRSERTWSGTPSGLRRALGRRADVVDLGVKYSLEQFFLKYAYTRRRHGRWGSIYNWSPMRDRMIEGTVRSALDDKAVDAVVQIGDLARLEVPYYLYKDLSFSVLEDYYDPVTGAPGFKGIDLDTIKYRKERQHGIWESSAGLFAMSEWIADALVNLSGVPREKITVVYAGTNSIETFVGVEDCKRLAEERVGGAAKLLFVGRDFYRKGGDIVVKALSRVRREHSPDVCLTVVGPKKWPLPGNVPENVDFLGSLSNAETARLYRTHDVLVMPSRFEAYGIVFTEALAHGVPVIGRSAFAMPEFIQHGKNGALVTSDDPEELASAIVAVLEDPDIREFTVRNAKDVRVRFSWDAVADRMLFVLSSCG